MQKLTDYLKRNRSRTIFWKILFSYISLLAVFIVSSVVLYHISSTNMRNEIRRGSYLYLQKTQQEIEDRIIAARSIMEKVYMDDAFQKSAWKDVWETLGMMDQYTMKKNLSKWQAQDVVDIFVCYTNSNKIISATNSAAETETYFSTYYKTSSFSEDDTVYDTWLNGKNAGSCAIRYPGIADTDTILLTMNYPAYRGSECQAVIGVTIRPEILKNALQGIQDGSLLIFNKENQIIAESGEKIADFVPDTDKGNYYTQWIGGARYVIQTSVSDKSGYTYVHAIPESVFWNRQKEYLHTVWLFLAVFGGIGLLMIWWLSRVNYQPWNNLMETAQEAATVVGGTLQSEDQYIRATFMETVRQRQDYYDKLQQGKNTEAENQLFKYLRAGSGEESITAILKEKKLLVPENAYVLTEFHIENWDQNKIQDLGAAEMTQNIKKNISALLDSAEEKRIIGNLIIQLDRRTYLTLLAVPKGTLAEDLLTLVYQICILLEKTCGIHNTALLSEVGEEYTGLPELYQQIVECMGYRYILGRENIIQYADIRDRRPDYKRNTEYIWNHIWDWLKQKKNTTSEFDLINEIISVCIEETKADAESIGMFQKDMTEIMEQMGKQMKMSKEPLWGEQMQSLTGSSSWMEYKYYLSELMKLLQLTYQAQDTEKDVVSQVAEYIEENYYNPDLNLNYLADRFQISAQHLSRIFRVRYNDGILDYIAGIRIRQAQSELQNSSLTIEAIAQKNGFVSSASFIRTFKKITGMTPGAYRDNQEKQQNI